VKEASEKAERANRKVRDALSKVWSRKHEALSPGLPNSCKNTHTCRYFWRREWGLVQGWWTWFLWVVPITPRCPILLCQLYAWVCRVALLDPLCTKVPLRAAEPDTAESTQQLHSMHWLGEITHPATKHCSPLPKPIQERQQPLEASVCIAPLSSDHVSPGPRRAEA